MLGAPGAAGPTAWPARAGPGLCSQDEGALCTRLARGILLPLGLSVRLVSANVPDSEAWPPRVSLGRGRWSQGRQAWLPWPQPGLVCRAPVSGETPEEESSRGGAGGARQVSRSLRPRVVSQLTGAAGLTWTGLEVTFHLSPACLLLQVGLTTFKAFPICGPSLAPRPQGTVPEDTGSLGGR